VWLVISLDLLGIKLFVQWYEGYHGNETRSQGKEDDGTRSDLDIMLLNKEVDRRNVIFQQRIDQLRNKCVSCDPAECVIVLSRI